MLQGCVHVVSCSVDADYVRARIVDASLNAESTRDTQAERGGCARSHHGMCTARVGDMQSIGMLLASEQPEMQVEVPKGCSDRMRRDRMRGARRNGARFSSSHCGSSCKQFAMNHLEQYDDAATHIFCTSHILTCMVLVLSHAMSEP